MKQETTDGPSSEEEWEQVRADREQQQQRVEEEAKRQREENRKKYEEYQFRWSGFRPWYERQGPTEARAGDKTISVTMDEKRIKSLLMLCHPDKHGNTETSAEVTRWLIDLKQKIDMMKEG